VRLSLGYPDDATEARVMTAQRAGHPLERLQPVTELSPLLAAQEAVAGIFVHESMVRYIQRLVAETRRHPHAAYGASTRGAIGLLRAAQAMAAIEGGRFVTPDHVQRLAESVLSHRVVVKPRSRVQGVDGRTVVAEVVQRVEVPIDLEPV
jgi:MoxR-like ATPase